MSWKVTEMPRTPTKPVALSRKAQDKQYGHQHVVNIFGGVYSTQLLCKYQQKVKTGYLPVCNAAMSQGFKN